MTEIQQLPFTDSNAMTLVALTLPESDSPNQICINLSAQPATDVTVTLSEGAGSSAVCKLANNILIYHSDLLYLPNQQLE